MIEGVVTQKLRLVPDERGYLVEIFRSDNELFEKFGQVYMTVAYPGVIKGWHYHKKQNDFFVVIKGMAKVVLYDRRKGSKTFGEVNEFFMGEQNPLLLKIPKEVLHGFKAIGTDSAYLINCPTELYVYDKPDEYRIPNNSKEIPYDWEIKMK